jgi:protease-4
MPPPVPRPRGTVSAGRGGRTWLWVVLGLMAVCGLGLAGLVLAWVGSEGGSGLGSGSPGAAGLREVLIRKSDARDKIAVLTIDGVIMSQPVDGEGRTLEELIGQQLERVAADDRVKAVILKVDSPGGEVLASDEIYNHLWKFQEEHEDIPVVVSMGSVAASGGYYVSAPCQWIIANELTMTGSIGVIFHSYNYRGLMDKVGVRPAITKSGKLKDMMSGEKAPGEELPEEREILQSMIDESFGRFKQVIRAGRQRAAERNAGDGTVLAEDWESIADGRILSGKAAMEKGLVDELGNFETAVGRAKKMAGIEEARLVSYDPPVSFGSLFRLFGKAGVESRTVRLDLGLGMPTRVPQGRMYFISPVHLH